jgi:hypothetical protein
VELEKDGIICILYQFFASAICIKQEENRFQNKADRGFAKKTVCKLYVVFAAVAVRLLLQHPLLLVFHRRSLSL